MLFQCSSLPNTYYSYSQDVDLVHCRIGKIEGLGVLRKAKVSRLTIVCHSPIVKTSYGYFMENMVDITVE